jgi:protein-glucosylgalactosylhydroxylysine glucosidase
VGFTSYLAHEDCPTTFEEFNKDHPSMLGAFGFISSDRISIDYMKKTLNRVMECWDFSTMWGWDFALMAMTAVRAGEPEIAIDILLKETPKNCYVLSGNNFQKSRTDLPIYLPGNGSLLLAVSLMTAGYKGCTEKLPGFPKNGMWNVTFENIIGFPS